MTLLTITIKGFTGHFRADVIAFNKYNKEQLARILNQLLGTKFNGSETLTTLKNAAQEYDDTYPAGFKHIEGIYCYYHCLG